jgi:hypothetical protein
MRRCKCGCGNSIEHKHPNAKFINKKHKDRYHNLNNPRGRYEYLNNDGLERIFYDVQKCHPFSSEALGQE